MILLNMFHFFSQKLVSFAILIKIKIHNVSVSFSPQSSNRSSFAIFSLRNIVRRSRCRCRVSCRNKSADKSKKKSATQGTWFGKLYNVNCDMSGCFNISFFKNVLDDFLLQQFCQSPSIITSYMQFLCN